jgi:RimJ/RimL family protein N-acetyltransferase
VPATRWRCPILEANWDYLSPWIPARLRPAPLATRPTPDGVGAAFAGDREWRYGLFLADGERMLGEVSLFPRSHVGRVPLAEADRAEVGYWLRVDETGRGYVTEAVRAVLEVARPFTQFALIEVRCDARNAASAAVPRRLGFTLATTLAEPGVRPDEPSVQLQVWTRSNVG